MKQKNQAVIVAGFLALLATATIAQAITHKQPKHNLVRQLLRQMRSVTAGAPGGGTCTPASPNAHPSWGARFQLLQNRIQDKSLTSERTDVKSHRLPVVVPSLTKYERINLLLDSHTLLIKETFAICRTAYLTVIDDSGLFIFASPFYF